MRRMPENQTIAPSQHNLKINTLSNQAQLKTSTSLETFCHPRIMIGFTVSLATTVMYLTLSSQTALATSLKLSSNNNAIELENLIFPSESLPSPTIRQDKSAAFLPPISNLITAFKTRLVNLSLVPQEKSELEFSFSPGGINSSLESRYISAYSNSPQIGSTTDFQNTGINSKLSSPFSTSATSATKPAPKLYKVQPGDTVSTIAKRYRVSRGELIKLNNIKNSHIIFVNQQLKIPTQIADSSLTSFPLEQPKKVFTFVDFTDDTDSKLSLLPSKSLANVSNSNSGLKSGKHSQVNQPLQSSTPSSNHYVAKLRAEIDQLRSRYQDKTRPGKANQKVNTSSLSHRLPRRKTTGAVLDSIPLRLTATRGLPAAVTVGKSAKNGDNIPFVSNTYNQNTSTPKISAAPLQTSQQGLGLDSLGEEIASLQLPPLDTSEHYLPSAFDGYTWPAQGVLTSGYGYRWGRLHGGIDIAAPIGTPVLAAASGEVVTAGWHSGGYGNLVKIRHLDESVTLYAHNNRILVNLGQRVNKGEQIAEIGNTGYSTGPHLHFEIHPKGSGAVNPLALLSAQ